MAHGRWVAAMHGEHYRGACSAASSTALLPKPSLDRPYTLLWALHAEAIYCLKFLPYTYIYTAINIVSPRNSF